MDSNRYFKDHVAVICQDTDEVTIVEWGNKNGSGGYYIRYVMDKKYGTLTITGDLGAAVFSWYCPKSFQDFYNLCSDVGYFASKILCTTDKYTYRDEDIVKDLNTFTEKLTIKAGKVKAEILEERLLTILGRMEFGEDVPYPQSLNDLMDDIRYYYNVEWDDFEMHRIGRRLSYRIQMWRDGLRMAYQQLFSPRELKVEFGSSGYLYFPTHANTCEEAKLAFEEVMEKSKVNIDNMAPTHYVLRDKEGKDIGEIHV